MTDSATQRLFRLTIERAVRLNLAAGTSGATYVALIEQPHPTNDRRWQRVEQVLNDAGPIDVLADVTTAMRKHGGLDGLAAHLAAVRADLTEGGVR